MNPEYLLYIPFVILATLPVGFGVKMGYEAILDRVRSRRAQRMFDDINDHTKPVPEPNELDLTDLSVSAYAKDPNLRSSVRDGLERIKLTQEAKRNPPILGDGSTRPH